MIKVNLGGQMEYFDSHMHLDDDKFDIDREEVIEKIWNAGVTKCIDIGTNVETSKKAIEIAKNNHFIYAAVGLHPEDIPQTEEELWKTISEIKKLATENKKVVAIGEIGLDYYWRQDNIELQKKAFIKQIEIANELKLPISIHTRDSIDDTIAIIRNIKIENAGVLHCCPFNPELIKHGLEAGLYIAFGGTCTFKNSKNAGKIIEMVPNDKILIETDSPYLAPEPVRGTRNDSSNLKYIVQKLAEFKNMAPEEIAKITYQNAERLFNVNRDGSF